LRRLEPTIAGAERPECLIPVIGLTGRDLAGEVHALDAGPGARLGHGRLDVDSAVAGMADDTVGRTDVADAAGELPRVDSGDAGQVLELEPAVEMLRRAEVRRLGDVHPQDDGARGRRRRLDVLRVGPDIADMRKGEGDDL